MNPEEKQMLAETLRLTQENNQLLHKIRRSAFIANLMTLVYWVLIFGVPIVLYYYFLQPYVSEVLSTYQGGADQAQGITEQLKNNPQLGKLLEKFGL